MVSSPPQTWSPAQVAAFLTEDLELPQRLADNFVENAVSGADLATFTDEDLTQELQCSSLQARKIRKALTQLGVGSSPPTGSATAPAPAARAAAPPAAAPAAAPRPATAPTAPAGEPNPASAFDPADLARYRQLQAQIAGLHGVQGPELTTAQQLMEEVVQRMFARPPWTSNPRQNALIDEARVLEGQAAEAHRGVSTYGRGTQLLNSAATRLQAAIKSLHSTQVVNMLGAARGVGFAARTGVPGGLRPGRLAGDLAEMAIFRKANDQVQQAARETAEARSLLGAGLPQVDEAILGHARSGMFANMLVGGAVMDVVQAAATRKSISETERLLSQVTAAAQWAQSNLAAYTQSENGLRAQVEGRRGELRRFRGEMLAAAVRPAGDDASLAAQVGGMSLHDTQHPAPAAAPAPQPAYAAPQPAPQPVYAAPQPAYAAPQPTYAAQPPAYGAPPPAYAYGAPPPTYGGPPPAYFPPPSAAPPPAPSSSSNNTALKVGAAVLLTSRNRQIRRALR